MRGDSDSQSAARGMSHGFIKLPRHLLVVAETVPLRAQELGLFSYLLLRANYRACRFRGRWICPGQSAFSQTKLADELKVPRTSLQWTLKRLVKAGLLHYRSVGKAFCIVTICNWNSYNDLPCSLGQRLGRQLGNDWAESKKDKIPKEAPEGGGARLRAIDHLNELGGAAGVNDVVAAVRAIHPGFKRCSRMAIENAFKGVQRECWCKVLSDLAMHLDGALIDRPMAVLLKFLQNAEMSQRTSPDPQIDAVDSLAGLRLALRSEVA